MPSTERDTSRDSDRHLRHQHSASLDGGRAIVPMYDINQPKIKSAPLIETSRWDSSDPERAPPPLPMNPSSPSIAASRPNTSTAIQSAHAALTEKARENGYITNATPKRIEQSPERSLIKGAAHKRMQSLQTSNVRDLSNLIEGGGSTNSSRSPERSSGRPATPLNGKDSFPESRSPERDSRFLLEGSTQEKEKIERDLGTSRCTTPTPAPKVEMALRDTPRLRPSLRKPPQSILGENAPPQSATMLALQNNPGKDVEIALANVTNSSTALVRTPQTFDAISNQILSLTSIATSLQREMAQLSRRSKDNATDLVSLKKATNARDEDIRKSLRELVTNLNETGSRVASNIYAPGGLYLDDKAHNTTPSSRNIKPFVLPRIPSPNSFAASLDRESLVTPSSYAPDTVTSIALLEKILREMGTKEGQELLVSRLSEVAERLSRDGNTTAKKLDDLLHFIKSNTSQAMVLQNGGGAGNNKNRDFSFSEPPRLELDFDSSPRNGPMTQRVGALLSAGNKENAGPQGAARVSELLNEDIVKIIRTIKDSVAQGGGLTAEVKALVRELRGEVLGMGREIGRKLDQANNESTKDAATDKDRVIRVVQEGLEELRGHMDSILREHRRQSNSSTTSRQTVDYQEIHNAVRSAINQQSKTQAPALAKEDIVQAVKDAWENYKPEIEVQQFGLERDELLTCLKEGIQEFSSKDNTHDGGATRDEVFAAVVEGLKHFSPPRIDTEGSLSREEILDAVRECLEEFEFPSAPAPEPMETGLTREDMLDAVTEGLHAFDFPKHDQISVRDIDNMLTRDDVLHAVKEVLQDFDFSTNTTAISRGVGDHLTRDDVYEAVKASFDDSPNMDAFSDQIMDRLHEIMETMQSEFKAVSDEAKQNVAAHGRDTEQVLDATKDGFERLRTDIESYVDRANGADMKDDIISHIRDNFDSLRADIDILMSKENSASLDTVRLELETLRESMTNSLVPSNIGIDKEDILNALKQGIDELRRDIERPRNDSNESVLSGTGEILDALHDGLNNLRTEVEKIVNKPVDMTVNYEILDTLRLGLEGVRADIDRLRENGHGERAVAEINDSAVIAADSLKRNDIEHLEVLITQLRIKVEALENMPPPMPQSIPETLSRNDLAEVEDMLRNVHESVTGFAGRDQAASEGAVKKEDIDAIETLLRNTKAKIDEINPEQGIKSEQVDTIELLIGETRDQVSDLTTHLEDVSKKDDIGIVESLVRDILSGVEEMKERAAKEPEDLEKVTKTDVEAVEAVCLDVKTSIDQMLAADIAALASKKDVSNLEELLKEFKDRIELHAETNVKSFEERQAETVGVSERVTEVLAFLDDFKEVIKDKLDEGVLGVDSLSKALETFGVTITKNASISDDIREVFETMKLEFEKSNAGVVGTKLEADEKFQKTWDIFDSKFEEKFKELTIKYDEAQGAAEAAAEASAKAAEDKGTAIAAALAETKTATDDLKLLTDTLGTNFNESIEKIDETSKTVFTRVDETFTRVEETHADAKVEHQLTREQVFKTLSTIESLQGSVQEFSPKILESIKDVLLIVGQHYEHSKTSTTTLVEKIAERPAPPELPLLQDVPPPPVEKYDDTNVHEKLDKLVNHMDVAGKSFAQLDMLDRIHQQVMQTAAEVTNFVSNQTQRIANDHEDKEKAVEVATIALEKRLAQKEQVEVDVVGLREEENRLRESVAILKAEQEDLARQKIRLSADVSSLETALRLRRDELHAMEARAEGLERRILEGVIDHSRALLLSKPNPTKPRDTMSRKRVSSQATSTTGSTLSGVASRASNTTQSAVNIAMGGNRAMLHVPNHNGANHSRRNFSLNQITNNVPTGGFKRSHSVKTNGGAGALRKASWGGSMNKQYGDLNKENLTLKESEEDDELASIDDVSDGETMRRSSRATVLTTSTGTGVSESVTGTDWTESVSGDESSENEDTELDQEDHPVVLYGAASEVA